MNSSKNNLRNNDETQCGYSSTVPLLHSLATPTAVGLYDPRYERDSCGVGFIADIKGRASRKNVSDANKLLVRMTHRGAKQGEDGDGAGIMVGIPHRFFKKLSLSGQLSFLSLPPMGRYGVGMIFLPNGEENETRRCELMENIERVIRSYGLSVLGWRSPLPTKSSILGPIGRATEPFTVQIFVCQPCDNEDEAVNKPRTHSFYYDDAGEGMSPLIDQYDPESSVSAFGYSTADDIGTSPTELPTDLERLLYLVRRKLSRWTDMYVCSFSCRLVTYKGQLQSEQLFSYYDDLMDEDFMSYLAIVHARFSTNTFPTWDRAHPFRRIAHNGEINTVDGNRRWLIAKEGKASCPTSLGFQLAKSDIIPFEEPCHVTRFFVPGPPDINSSQPITKKKSSPSLAPCLSSSRLHNDSLAVPTDIVTARRSSVASSESHDSRDSIFGDSFSINSRSGKDKYYGTESVSQEDHRLGKLQSEDIDKQEERSTNYSSDSATLDGTLELLMMAGRDIAEAVMLLVPEAMQKGEPKWKRDFHQFMSCVMEPWDGPALISFTDGLQLGAQLDRNGLRPGRFIISKDGRLVLASEVGVVDIPPSMILQKGRLVPGKMLLIDFREGRVVSDEEIKKKYATKYPYGEWIDQYSVRLDDLSIAMTDDELRHELILSPMPEDERLNTLYSNETKPGRCYSELPDSIPHNHLLKKNNTELNGWNDIHSDMTSQLIMFGYSCEKVELLLGPMAKYAAEVMGSMGNDSPLSCLSDLPKTPGDYFQQMFAQGTNPPIDPIRESGVMSLSCPIGPQGDIFTVTKKHVKRIFLERPVVNPSEFRALITLPGFPTATVDLSISRSYGQFDLEGRILQLQLEAEHAVRQGSRILILSDRRAGIDRLPIWSTIAVGAIHLHLIRKSLRLDCAIIIETGEASEVHEIAMLLSSGADAVYPYLAYRSLSKVQFTEDEDPLPLSRLIENYITAVHLGLLRVMSKIGVCTMLSYKGGFYFQPLGIDSSVLRVCFDGGLSAIGGINFNIFAEDTLRLHLKAYPPRPMRQLVDPPITPCLPDLGEYRFVSIQDAEIHSNHPETISYLQQSVQTNDFSSYRKFCDLQNALVDEIEIRGQLEFVYGTQRAIPLNDVEPAKDIVKRFVTAAISFGAVSEEVYHTIAKAMNAIGSRSNTGEGGECEESLNGTDSSIRSRTKQIASGRFGVTAAYLCDADELQIKVGQGAKPGEGGELPGYKVVGKIAATRRSTPGVGLISPPPHHDMYSIEDLAQLIMDLKHGNPRARISLKLVSKLGIGVIAAGCVKAKADHLVISGSCGSTAASKLSSVKHSGLPWEIGLAETHQTLCLNSLRERVALQVDGQLKTGRDVVFAALLGAEEFAFATQPLISLGCVMTRKCHLNACPTGIATQDPELRKRFRGKPEHLINYFFMVAEEVRTYMARLGFKHLIQMIGRSDLLRPKSRLKEHWKRSSLNFHQSLVPGWKLSCPFDKWWNKGESPIPRPMYCITAHDHELDKVLDREIIRRARRSLEHQIPVTITLPIRNGDRTVGGLLAYEVATRYSSKGLPTNTISVNFRGSAGQSFACWLPNGVTFRLSGDCNDFVGKGLSGGVIIVKPPSESPFFNESDHNIIIGNSALYGATSGRAFFAGVAGERFAVRNSGAIAVVEGCGDYGCEYMTRGVVVVLGQSGRNFAAGMTGGIAYVLDLDVNKVNLQMVDLQPLGVREENTSQDIASTENVSEIIMDQCITASPIESGDDRTPRFLQGLSKDAKILEGLVLAHYDRTKSAVAQRILANLSDYLPRFTKIFPKEIKRVLKQAISEYLITGSPDAATILDDWETMTTQAHKYDSFYLQTLPYALRHYAEKFQNRRRQLKRMQVLDVHENALRVLGGLETPSPLEQYVAELTRTNRLTDLLAEENSDQLAQIMRMTRTVYAHWRTGYSKGLRKEDSDTVKQLLPVTLTPSRRAVLKRFLLDERRELSEHLKALDGSKLAELLLSQFKESITEFVPGDLSSSMTAMSGQKEWEAFVVEATPQRTKHQQLIQFDKESTGDSSTIETPRMSHFKQSKLTTPSTIASPQDQLIIQKPFLVRHPEKLRGFHLYAKQNPPLKASNVRVLDWEEISLPINSTSRLYEQLMKTQASRCMDCGTPSCHYPNSGGGGCPLGNRIPTWNSLVFEGQWKIALDRLLDTNNFPEFTGRVCPGPCEDSCILASRGDPVAIKSIELAIIEKGFQEHWIKPMPPLTRTPYSIGIIGSGPAGLAAAQQLNRVGHQIIVYEKADRIGGLLMYGIPNMKLDKKKVVQRRVDLLAAEGITFQLNCEIGNTIMLDSLLDTHHAVLLAVGQSIKQDLKLPGRQLNGIIQGMKFLIESQKNLLDSSSKDNESFIDACGKRVIVIGSGDIAIDCIATAIRMGCSEIIQFCNAEQLPYTREVTNPWPQQASIFKVEYGHEEAIVLQGRDPREYCIRPLEFIAGPSGNVVGIKAIRTISDSSSSGGGGGQSINYRMTMKSTTSMPLSSVYQQGNDKMIDIKGTERIYPCDLILLALGFQGVDSSIWTASKENISRKPPIRVDSNKNIMASPKDYRTNLKNVFACGDCRTGSSLVVTSIAEGRDAARAIDDFLMQEKLQQQQQQFIQTRKTPCIDMSVDRQQRDTNSHSVKDVIKSESLPCIAPHLGHLEPRRTVGARGTLHPLTVTLASGPGSVLPSSLPAWTNPLKRLSRIGPTPAWIQ